MHIVTTSLRKVFKKLKKRHAISAQPPRTPLQLKKHPNNYLCSEEISLQLDEEIKSLAIIVAEK